MMLLLLSCLCGPISVGFLFYLFFFDTLYLTCVNFHVDWKTIINNKNPYMHFWQGTVCRQIHLKSLKLLKLTDSCSRHQKLCFTWGKHVSFYFNIFPCFLPIAVVSLHLSTNPHWEGLRHKYNLQVREMYFNFGEMGCTHRMLRDRGGSELMLECAALWWLNVTSLQMRFFSESNEVSYLSYWRW